MFGVVQKRDASGKPVLEVTLEGRTFEVTYEPPGQARLAPSGKRRIPGAPHAFTARDESTGRSHTSASFTQALAQAGRKQ